MPATAALRVLVVDDRGDAARRLTPAFARLALAAVAARTSAEALAAARMQPIDAAVVDLTHADPALDLVSHLRRLDPRLPVVALVPAGRPDLAREAARRGARESADQSSDPVRLAGLVRTQAELGAALRRVLALEAELARAQNAGGTAAEGLLDRPLREVERALIARALARCAGNISRTARVLGLSRASLYRRLERHGLAAGGTAPRPAAGA